MSDAGTRAADQAQREIEERLNYLYSRASKSISEELKDFTKKFKAKDKVMREKLKAGQISSAQYQSWKLGQVFIGKQWQDKLDSITTTLNETNQIANAIVEGKKRAVFGANATYQAYELENGLHQDLSFSIYDSATVTRIIRENPELLPRKVVNGRKDKAWNRTNVARVISQGVVNGESITDMAKNLARKTSSTNMKAMVRYARTAMTSAQNAGRIEVMQEAQDMGIKVQKQWLATLDSKTRDAHAALDGQIAEVNKPFKSELGDIMYPGDPAADPANVYNCRCTLTYVYPDYAQYARKRRDNETKELIPDMTYSEWKATKNADNKAEIYTAKQTLDELTNQCILNDANKTFSGIWKEDVTYKDWEKRKDSIPDKRDYYNQRIDQANWKIDESTRQGRHGSATDYDTVEYWQAKLKESEDKLKLLNEYEKNGAANYQLLKDRDAAMKAFKDAMPKPPAPPGPPSPFGQEAYSQARKDAAVWSIDKAYVDSVLRGQTGKVWAGAAQAQKEAIYDYTRSYHKFNEPLRGIEYGSNVYKGVGNTDLNAGYKNNGMALNAMTEIIDKCTYEEDVWLQRGCNWGGMDKFFQIDSDLLQHGTQEDLANALLGKNITEYGFMSCGTAKGQGFSSNPIIMNIYAPSGTKMMYAEPFSAFGSGSGLSWDGQKSQSSFGGEFETILQQGTQMRITKVEVKKDSWGDTETIYFDLEVVDQSNQQLYKP